MGPVDLVIASVHPHIPASDAEDWFALVVETAGSGGAPDDVVQAIAVRAGERGVSTSAIEAFRRAVRDTSDPADVLSELSRERPASLVERYRAATASDGADGTGPDAGGDPRELAWVDPATATLLEGRAGPGWRQATLTLLDGTWPDWDQSDDATRLEFLGNWWPHLPGEPRLLEWVTEDQQQSLAVLGGDRDVIVVTFLDRHWPDWTDADDDGRRSFLDGWLPTLLAEYGVADVESVPGSADGGPRDLGWLTEDQQVALAGGIGPGWPDLLQARLDEYWPVWTEATDDGRREFVTDWLPVLIGQDAGSAEPDTSAAMDAAEIEARVAAEVSGLVDWQSVLTEAEFTVAVAEAVAARAARG